MFTGIVTDVGTLDLTDVTDASDLTVTVAAADAADRCGNALAADATLAFVGVCASPVAPTFTSSEDDRFFEGTSLTHTFTFDEDVTILDGAFEVDGGATLTVDPPLPATGASFEVTIEGLVDGNDYLLLADNAAITDVCGDSPAASQLLSLGGCGAATPALTSATVIESCAATQSYTFTFDDDVTLAEGAIVLDGDGAIDSITPALPATSDTFVVTMSAVTAAVLTATPTLPSDCSATTYEVDYSNLGTIAPVTFDFTGATIVTYDLPNGCDVRIDAAGAEGGSNTSSPIGPGLGASMSATFTGLGGMQLQILVGEKPSFGGGNGGGGGTFVTLADNSPLLVAGGGAGSCAATDALTKHGDAGEDGNPGSAGGGNGGTAGSGGAASDVPGFQSGAGGGLLTNGADGWAAGSGGLAFVNGGAGANVGFGNGGFGGGGNGSGYVVGGAGGGYSGGGTGGNSSGGQGGGGGSFSAGTDTTGTSGTRAGHGQVTITFL